MKADRLSTVQSSKICSITCRISGYLFLSCHDLSRDVIFKCKKNLKNFMHGAYVDHQSQMILVSQPDKDNTHEVLLTDTTQIITLCKRSLVKINDKQGVFNGVDTINWSDGSRWTRLRLTETQYRYLTRRPYVPLTLLAIQIIRLLIHRIMFFCRGIFFKKIQ